MNSTKHNSWNVSEHWDGSKRLFQEIRKELKEEYGRELGSTRMDLRLETEINLQEATEQYPAKHERKFVMATCNELKALQKELGSNDFEKNIKVIGSGLIW